MTLWRLEWLRMVRTRRLLALFAAYGFFGFVGPFTARYMAEIVERFGGGVTVVFPDPTPVDGIAQFSGSASQIGVLVAVAVAAGALTIDALPEMSVFLRTRVGSVARILFPRYLVALASVAAAYLAGVGIAWYETRVLLGGVSAAGLTAGTLCVLLYLAFALALVAAVGTRMASAVGTIGITVVGLLLLPVIGIAEAIGRWLPSHLVGAQVDLLREGAVGGYLPAIAVTAAAAVVLLGLAVRNAAVREL
jgi:ABC-2 type transport system permease protein